jgi:nucleoside 2-deoxyribosyltransferase
VTEPQDPWEDPGWLEYAKHDQEEMLPMLKGSAITLALLGGDVDAKQACELGFMIMLDKPIIAVVVAGAKVPDKLIRVADEIVEGADMNDPDFQKRLTDAITRVQAKLASE